MQAVGNLLKGQAALLAELYDVTLRTRQRVHRVVDCGSQLVLKHPSIGCVRQRRLLPLSESRGVAVTRRAATSCSISAVKSASRHRAPRKLRSAGVCSARSWSAVIWLINT